MWTPEQSSVLSRPSHALIDSRGNRWARPVPRQEHLGGHCFHFPREEAEAQSGRVQIYTPTSPRKERNDGGDFHPTQQLPEGGDGNQDLGGGGVCVHLDFDSPPSQPRCRPLQQWPSKPGRGGSKQGGGQGQEAWDVGAGNRAEPSNLPGSLPFPQRS